jgi:transcriptional regulator with XRE-family HTH domain
MLFSLQELFSAKCFSQEALNILLSNVMPKNQDEDLADFVRRVMNEDKVSYRDIEERAANNGFQISNGYVSKIVGRSAQNISLEKLRALAVGLNRPEDEVFAVARGVELEANLLLDAQMNSMVSKYQKLSRRDKEAVAPLLRALQREIDERLEKANKE